jgi:hypothetical protein
MGIYPVRCQLLCTWTRLFLPCCYADARGRLTMWHPDSCSSYPATLGGSGQVPAVLLLDYLARQEWTGVRASGPREELAWDVAFVACI